MFVERSIVIVHDDVPLGEGTFGKCLFGNLKGIEVAIKMFKAKHSNKQHIINEVRVMSMLFLHRNRPMLLGVCIDKEPNLLMTKFIGLGDRSVDIEDFIKRDLSLIEKPIPTMVSLVVQVLQGLESIHHSGFLHNDLKPNNVLAEKRAHNSYTAVVIDFGKACSLHRGVLYKLKDKSARESHIQRYRHLAPELVYGEAPKSVYTDLYSMGYLIRKVNICKKSYKCDILHDISLGCMGNKWRERPGITYILDYIKRKSKMF